MKRICPHRGFGTAEEFCPYHGLNLTRPCFPVAISTPIGKFDSKIMYNIEEQLGEEFSSFTQLVKAPFQLWMQNTCDFWHLKTIHKDFSNSFTGSPYDIQISACKKFSSHRIKVRPEVIDRYKTVLGRQDLTDNFLHIMRAPEVSYTNFLDVFFSIEVATPINHKSCWVTTRFFTSNKYRRPPSALLMAARKANEKILEEDAQLCEKWALSNHLPEQWFPYEERIKAYLEYMEESAWQGFTKQQ